MGELYIQGKKPEARSQKPEARSQKPEEDSLVQVVFFWLLTNVSGPFWLLASVQRARPTGCSRAPMIVS
jgi:hypothetical protein